MPETTVTQATLDSINVEQSFKENRANLDALGGPHGLVQLLFSNVDQGLSHEQVALNRSKFGVNAFPEAPMKGFLSLLMDAFSDPTLIVLLCAASVSLIIGIIEEPASGWIEGAAIFIVVFLVANISAGNDYTKELQFRALESSSQNDERTSVLRAGVIERLNPTDLVVGDIVVLQVRITSVAYCVFFIR
jgi:magnesium-transporting ATPase (P-type)